MQAVSGNGTSLGVIEREKRDGTGVFYNYMFAETSTGKMHSMYVDPKQKEDPKYPPKGTDCRIQCEVGLSKDEYRLYFVQALKLDESESEASTGETTSRRRGGSGE